MTPGAQLAGSLADELERVAAIAAERAEALPSFREFLESPEYAGPYMAKVGIPPLVGAIVDASEGMPVDGIDDELAFEVFRLHLDELPLVTVPRVVVVNAGRQAGKTSNLLAPKCVHAALTQPAPFLRPGQVARAVIISPNTKLSEAAFNYCKGICETSPRIQRQIVKINDERILLRRTDGHLVEIVVGAADKGGGAARSATVLFCGLDEVAFFRDEAHTVNDRAIFDAAMGTVRHLEGAQIWMVSTPWIEGSGLMEELIDAHWGAPGSVLVAARVSSYALRGVADAGQLREDTDTAETYDREILARPLAAGSAGFFAPQALALALLRHPPSGAPEALGGAADWGFERDCAAVVVVERYMGGFFAPRLVEERHATPGDIDAAAKTVRDLGALAFAAGVSQIMGDPWKRPFCREHLHLEHITYVDAPNTDEGKAETYGAWKRVVEDNLLCLAHLDRAVAQYVVSQLRAVVATPIPGPGKKFKISSPRTKRLLEGYGAGKIGAHGDVASALVLAGWQAGARLTAKDWNIPKQAPQSRAAVPVAPRMGAGGSSAWLRGRSTTAGAGRGYAGTDEG